MKPPTIGNLSQSLNVDLREGKPLRVSAVDLPGLGTVYIEIKGDTPDSSAGPPRLGSKE